MTLRQQHPVIASALDQASADLHELLQQVGEGPSVDPPWEKLKCTFSMLAGRLAPIIGLYQMARKFRAADLLTDQSRRWRVSAVSKDFFATSFGFTIES
jgi:hypothetical protein